MIGEASMPASKSTAVEKPDDQHCRLLRARRERPRRRRAANDRDEFAPSDCLPVDQIHAKCGVQLRTSKQESTSSETDERCGNVRRTNPARPMSQLGHK